MDFFEKIKFSLKIPQILLHFRRKKIMITASAIFVSEYRKILGKSMSTRLDGPVMEKERQLWRHCL